MIPSLFRRGHTRWLELASAYLDGELSPRDLARFERHLPGCAECQDALSHAEETHNLLAQLPELQAPRSFQLTPELVARPVVLHEPGRGRPVALRLAQAATAVAVLAFATILTMDLAGAGPSTSHQALAPESLTQASTATDNRGEAAPPVATSTSTPTPLATETVVPLPPTAVPTAPPIVPPTVSGVGAQGFSPSPSPTSTMTATPTEPASTPTATPTEAAEATGPSQDFGAEPNAAGGNQRSGAKDASVDEYSTYQAASVTAGWYRPAEIALAIIAVAGIAATVVLGLRRRR
jgi:hypothetical protein